MKLDNLSRRFGTAKRLKQIMDLDDSGFNIGVFINLEDLYTIKYVLTFGSAKPTKEAQ